MKRRRSKHPTVKIADKLSPELRKVIDDQAEVKMRILANHLIDRLLEIQEHAVRRGLNINKEKAILIMEHQVK